MYREVYPLLIWEINGEIPSEILSVSVRPKRLALLAYLTLASADGAVSRDSLLAVFWPEHDQEHARNNLSQQIHHLRRSLGRDAISAQNGGDLATDRLSLWCDALEFDAAIREQEYERALGLYRGAILEGFHVSDVPEFERWLDGQRADYRRRAAEAAIALAGQAEEAGDWKLAAVWFRRALAIMPESEPAIRGLVGALANAGDSAGALVAFRHFEEALQEDFGVQPAKETRALVESVQRQAAERTDLTVGVKGTVAQAVPPATVRRRSRIRVVMAMVAAGSALGLGWWAVTRPAAASAEISSLVVLPFANLSGNPGQDYFVDGMHEAILGELGQISALRVISRTSAMHYKGTTKAVPEIARELGVDAVLEGSVTRARDTVRIQVQLIQAVPRERHLWAKSYDRPVSNVLALHAELAQAIAGEIEVAFSPSERQRFQLAQERARAHPSDPEAYDAYLKGRYHIDFEGQAGSVEKARRYYEEAIAQDPTFAEAYAALAEALVVLPGVDVGRATVAAQRALDLDPTLPEAHLALGIARMMEWDWAGSEASFQKAIDLNSNSAAAHDWYSMLLRQTVRLDEALSEAQRASELDPRSLDLRILEGWILAIQRRYEEAIEAWNEVLELEPEFGDAIYSQGMVYAMQGRGEDVISAARRAKAARLSVGEPRAMQLLGIGHALSGHHDRAEEILRELEARYTTDDYLMITAIYHFLGDDEKALARLEKGYELRWPWLPNVTAAPWFDDLRDRPRFRALRTKMGVP